METDCLWGTIGARVFCEVGMGDFLADCGLLGCIEGAEELEDSSSESESESESVSVSVSDEEEESELESESEDSELDESSSVLDSDSELEGGRGCS